MFRTILTYLASVATYFAVLSCSHQEIDMIAACDVIPGKGYVVKWDIYPKIEGHVKVYISEDPGKFDLSRPIAEADVDKSYIRIATPDIKRRFYFKIFFNDKISRVVGTRGANMKSAYVFRDFGGYRNEDNEYTKWGMIYRSGRLDTLSDIDRERFHNLGIRTIIDLSNDSSDRIKPYGLNVRKTLKLSMNNFDNTRLEERIYDGEFRKGDARIFMQDFFISLTKEDACKKYAEIFELLEDEENYPIVITSRYGKGYCDFASVLLLSVLGVPEDLILEDYTWANQYFNSRGIRSRISGMGDNVQESITRIIRNNRSDLVCTFNFIEREFGSMDNFLSDRIGMDGKKSKTLRKILLASE